MSKRSIAFTKPPEPSFIKKMKESIGYQEPDTVETKMKAQPYDAENDVEKDDEKPVVVVLKPGDLTEEQVKEIEESCDDEKRIVFSKPVKTDEEKNSLDFSSKKKKELQKRIDSEREKTKKVKNSSLLSFEEDEDY